MWFSTNPEGPLQDVSPAFGLFTVSLRICFMSTPEFIGFPLYPKKIDFFFNPRLERRWKRSLPNMSFNFAPNRILPIESSPSRLATSHLPTYPHGRLFLRLWSHHLSSLTRFVPGTWSFFRFTAHLLAPISTLFCYLTGNTIFEDIFPFLSGQHGVGGWIRANRRFMALNPKYVKCPHLDFIGNAISFFFVRFFSVWLKF